MRVLIAAARQAHVGLGPADGEYNPRVTQHQVRDSTSATASPHVSGEAVEQLSDADRELLGWHLAAAARESFPESERIGKTPQQDFYFRELLERLLWNFAEL